MTTTEPTQGTCERCKEDKPLTRYEVQHVHWYEPDSYSCHWCLRNRQPLLCGACTVLEAAEESRRHVSDSEWAVVGFFRRAAELENERRAS